MKINKKKKGEDPESVGPDFFEKLWEKSFTYIKTVVDVVREPVLILDKDLRVMAANEPFYKTFDAKAKDTEGKIVYDLGDGQWDIAPLRKLLGDILKKQTFFKGFQVAHDFPLIGRKVMILNAREIHVRDDDTSKAFPPIIVLAIEDVTEMMVVADMLANHAKQIEEKLMARSQKLETHISVLEKQINELKNKRS